MTCVLLVKFVGDQSAGGLVGESDQRFSAFDSFLDIHGNVLNMICILALRFFCPSYGNFKIHLLKIRILNFIIWALFSHFNCGSQN